MSAMLMTEQEIEAFLLGKKDNQKKVQKVEFPFLKPMHVGTENRRIDTLGDIKLDVVAELGTATLTVMQLLNLNKGDVIELNKQAGEYADIYINERKLGRGEILVIAGIFGVRLNSLLDFNEDNINPEVE